MKKSGESIVWMLTLEFVPAAIFGSAVAFASAAARSLPPFGIIPILVGGAAFAASWLTLRRLGRSAKPLPLADFDQSELERELANLAEEMETRGEFCGSLNGEAEPDELLLEDECPASAEDELLLEDRLDESQDDSRVVPLFNPASQTAGEMQARIENHLQTTPRPPLSDATQELHAALSALRRSLR